MPGIEGKLTQKLGPLPVWGWAALLLVGVLGYWFVTKTGPFAGSPSASSQGAPSSDSTDATTNLLAGLVSSLQADLQALANRAVSGPVAPVAAGPVANSIPRPPANQSAPTSPSPRGGSWAPGIVVSAPWPMAGTPIPGGDSRGFVGPPVSR